MHVIKLAGYMNADSEEQLIIKNGYECRRFPPLLLLTPDGDY